TTRNRSPLPLKVWEVSTHRPIHLLNGHTGYCTAVDFSRDGTVLASGSRDGTVILWSTQTWKVLRTLQNPDRGVDEFDDDSPDLVLPVYVEDVAFSPDGKSLVMASYTGNLHLWDVDTGELIAT